MGSGYGGQLVALDVQTPYEMQNEAAQVSEAQSRAQAAKTLYPAQAQIAQQQAAMGQLTLNQQTQLNSFMQHMYQKRLAAANAAQPQDSPPSPLSAASAQDQGPDQAPAPTPAAPDASQSSPLFDPRVQSVMSSINPDDPEAAEKWDAGMQAIAKDVPQAAQFVGHYSRSAVDGWRSQTGAHSVQTAMQSPLARAPLPPVQQGASFAQAMAPLAAEGPGAPPAPGATPLAQAAPLAAPAAPASPLAAPAAQPRPISPMTGRPTVDPDELGMATLFPKEYGEYQKMQGMIAYQSTGNPEYLRRFAPQEYQQLASAAKEMSDTQKQQIELKTGQMAQAANEVLVLAAQAKAKGLDPQKVPEVRAAYNQGVVEFAKNGWITPQVAQAELQNPIDFGNLSGLAVRATTWSTYMEASGQAAGNKAAAELPYREPDQQYIGTDNDGHPIVINKHDPRATPRVLPVDINAKPGAAASAFQTKQEAYLSIHPGDQEGALNFANGQKAMPYGEAQIAAKNAALREQANASLTGQPFDVNAAYQRNLQDFTTGGVSGAPGAPIPQAPSAGVVNGMSPAQKAAVQTYIHVPRHTQVGTVNNPVVLYSPDQFAKLPKGTHYIDRDGKLYTK